MLFNDKNTRFFDCIQNRNQCLSFAVAVSVAARPRGIETANARNIPGEKIGRAVAFNVRYTP